MTFEFIKPVIPGAGKYLVVARYTFDEDGRYFLYRFRTDDITDEAIIEVLSAEVMDVLKLTTKPKIHLLTFNAKEEMQDAPLPG